MIIVCGFCRTGTSVMMECLKNSDFNPGAKILKPKDCSYLAMLNYNYDPNLYVAWDQKYWEHPTWGMMNYKISINRGADVLTSFNGDKDLILNSNKKERSLLPKIHNMMCQAKTYFENKNVEILKDPWGTFALSSWIKRFKLFQTAKYIWTRRDPVKRAKSQLRFQLKNKCLKGFLITSKAIEIGQNHEEEIKKVMPLVDHIEIWLEDILDKTAKVGEKLSDFIGKKIDISAINKSEVWGN